MTNLKKRFLSDDQLSSLPDSLGNLTKHRKLYLSNNSFSSAPACVEKLWNNGYSVAFN